MICLVEMKQQHVHARIYKLPVLNVTLDLSCCWIHLFVVALSTFCFSRMLVWKIYTHFAPPRQEMPNKKKPNIIESEFFELGKISLLNFCNLFQIFIYFSCSFLFAFYLFVCLSCFIACKISWMLARHRVCGIRWIVFFFSPLFYYYLVYVMYEKKKMYMLLAFFHVVWHILDESNIRIISGISK